MRPTRFITDTGPAIIRALSTLAYSDCAPNSRDLVRRLHHCLEWPMRVTLAYSTPDGVVVIRNRRKAVQLPLLQQGVDRVDSIRPNTGRRHQ